MITLLLVVIYIAFISLGLPDSLLGSAWPSMYGELQVPLSYAGIISMIIAGGTILSSLFSSQLIRKLGTGLLTLLSVAMTAVALLGFSFSHEFWQLCLVSIPYGLGAGSVDAALNNYVALHFKSRHMSWLHCFWGLGATAGPYIMGLCLTHHLPWNSGYQTISILQFVLVAFLFLSLPLWRLLEKKDSENGDQTAVLTIRQATSLPGAKEVMTAFFCYCALEATTGLWAGSYMVLHSGMSAQTAAKWASLSYLGITLGRFLCGFVSDLAGDRRMIRIGQGISLLGILILFLPIGTYSVLAGLLLIGFGCAPVYPSLIHETPDNFGANNSQSVIGLQMACAYVGTTLMPPLFGLIAQFISIQLYPVYLLVLIFFMYLMTERMNKIYAKKSH